MTVTIWNVLLDFRVQSTDVLRLEKHPSVYNTTYNGHPKIIIGAEKYTENCGFWFV